MLWGKNRFYCPIYLKKVLLWWVMLTFAKAKKCKKILEDLRSYFAIIYLRLPPYLPDLNFIEKRLREKKMDLRLKFIRCTTNCSIDDLLANYLS